MVADWQLREFVKGAAVLNPKRSAFAINALTANYEAAIVRPVINNRA
jgi:hypothetical protein